MPYGLLQVPYGRSRPIDFGRSHFYVQHLTREELLGFLEAERLTFSDWFAAPQAATSRDDRSEA